MPAPGQKSSLIAATAILISAAPAWAASPTPARSGNADILFDAAFAQPGAPSATLAAVARGPAAVTRQTATVAAPGVVDRISFTTLAAPLTASVAGPSRDAGYELAISRAWPDALSLNAGRYGLQVSPHAGVGFSSFGNSAEAGATVSIGKSKSERAAERLAAMGVRDGKEFGDTSRWYLFAAVSGKSVGLNMTRAENGAWQNGGWSQDPSSNFVGDGQVGVGYRKGAMLASFGYVHREIKAQNAPRGADNDVTDSMAAFTLSFRPHK